MTLIIDPAIRTERRGLILREKKLSTLKYSEMNVMIIVNYICFKLHDNNFILEEHM
jgi:hypothetical protein